MSILQRRWFRWGAVVLAAGLLGWVIAGRVSREEPGNAAPLQQSVYVWQRVWTPQVREAVASLPPDITELLPLAAEVGFPPGEKKAQVTRVPWDFAVVKEVSAEITIVIRIGDSGAATKWEPWACEEIQALAETLVEETESQGVSVAGVQIDYDCPASRLADYRKLLTHLGEAKLLQERRLSFTSLPSWLTYDFEGMKGLAEASDSFVLQVHALDLPKTANDPVIVMDPGLARVAVKRAGDLGAPFVVALPTYSSFVVFDEAADKVVDVISEDLDFSKLLPEQHLILGEAPEKEIAQLMTEWSEGSRPRLCDGVVWYRLPVEGDVLNWPTATWDLVREGVVPERKLELEFRREPQGFDRVLLRNQGQIPESQFPGTIAIRIESPATLVGADGGRWYATPGVQGAEVIFTRTSQKHDLVPLPVGGEFPVGWVRKTGSSEYDAELSD